MYRTIKLKYHIFFWLVYFCLNVVRWGSYFDDYWYSLKSNLVEFPLHLVIVYFNIYFLIPRFVLKKKYGQYVVLLLITLGIHYVLRTSLNYLLVTKNIWPEAMEGQPAFGTNHMIAVIMGEFYVLGITAAIKFTVDFIRERNSNEQLRELQYTTELKYLKAQLQPHFFFNTLNNLYALTLKKSEVAPEVVLRLSDIMRYVIYDAKKKKISLLQEIEYIDNYIELEKIRTSKNIESQINITGDMDGIRIPPLLFLPYVENAFKHGLNGLQGGRLEISFARGPKSLSFTAINDHDSHKAMAKHKNGIGNKNTQRRLELLYGTGYSIKTEETETQYTVSVQIPYL